MTNRAIGCGLSRIEGKLKVTGRADYAADIKLPDQLYAGILRCPYPHARVLSVDTREAEAMNGVCAIASAQNTEDYRWYEEDVPLFSDTCRFTGDEVAAVAAVSEEVLADALASIRVDYEPRPFVVDLDRAGEPDAPLVHVGKQRNRVADADIYERGDIDKGFAGADVIIEQTYTTQCVLHNALEPHGCTASWQDDQLTLWVSTQGIHAVRSGIAEKLGLRDEQVRVISKFMGGGFGAKQVAWKQTLIAALLARQAKRPVQLMLDRHAENLAVGNRNPTAQHVRLGATAEGELCAISVRVATAAGAYSVAGESTDVAGIYELQYQCPNVRTEQLSFYTHTGPRCAFRAPGFAEGCFGLEQAMDELARRLQLDPIELRRRNHARCDQKSELPYSSPSSLQDCLDCLDEGRRKRESEREDNGRDKRRGFGVAACVWMAGTANPPAKARLRLSRDGTVDLFTGTQDIGTGTRTVLTQIAADRLACPLDCLRIHLGDTDVGLVSPTSAGSATVATLGPAIVNAADDLLAKLGTRGGTSGKEVPDIQALAAQLDDEFIEGVGECPQEPDDVSIRTFGAQSAEIEVDMLTGEIIVVRLAVAADCGTVINPVLARSQVLGGALQGLGYALIEERIVDEQLGLVLNANLEDYHIATAADAPIIDYLGINRPDRRTAAPYAKGIGEPPLIPTSAAIANAVFDATGIRVVDLPLNRERLIARISEKAEIT